MDLASAALPGDLATRPGSEAARRQAQRDFAASGANLAVGGLSGLPWSAAELRRLDAGSPGVLRRIASGLTSVVFQLRDDAGRHWALKRAWPQARVHNVDGQTSFLNEVQRRADINGLLARGGGLPGLAALPHTRYADYRAGLILSPWIDGSAVTDWDERRLLQVLQAACALWLEGLFEWDLSGGNLLDDGRQMRLFDFGYCYRFDPLRQFNPAGSGIGVPLFHPAERFETRHLSGVLLALERDVGEAAALALFRRAKQAAVEAYAELRAAAAARGASAEVLGWLDGIGASWRTGLRDGAEALYFAEQWRSHALDLADDLGGRSCTATTLARADWLLAALRSHPQAVRGALFGADAGLDAAALRARYAGYREQAALWQITAPPDPTPQETR